MRPPLALVVALSFASLATAAEKRPNILFAFADDWGRYASAYATLDGPGSINDVLHTPNFDRIAREGVLFRSAFVSSPSCTPCRSALLSGQHFWRTGRASILLGAVWDYSNPSYALMLAEAGYHIGETYKVWGPGTPNDAPYGAGRHAYENAGTSADYFGEVQAFDASLGVLLARLAEIGELDNTLVVVSGDHGAPGFPHGKCNLYDFGSRVSLAIRGPNVRGGRVVDDLVPLPDLAPTFLEIGGVTPPAVMTGRSLVALLASPTSGRVEPARDAVYIGRERHVDSARSDHTPYPQRAIRTHDFLYIVNFRPDRWPLGDPYRLDGGNPPTVEELTENTRATLPDEDAGPTKAWLVGMRHDSRWKAHFAWVYGKRPREELYDLKADPHQTKNVAGEPSYAGPRAQLERRLMDELRPTGDPRLVEDGEFFETPPLSGPVIASPAQSRKAK